NSLVLSQLVGWLNGLIAVRAPIAPKEPTVARATKQFSFMPKYLPVTTSEPICEFLLRNSGPRIVDLMMRAHGLSGMMPGRNAGSLVLVSKKSMNNSEYFMSLCALLLSIKGMPSPSPIEQPEKTYQGGWFEAS